MKDESNFFKLAADEQEKQKRGGGIFIDDRGNVVGQDNDSPKEELKKYMESLPPSAYKYLKGIQSNIEKRREIPYVMSIEGGFGSGKTHFVTRLCQYMMDQGIDAVYFNAFEYDTINPKGAVLDAISKSKFQKIKNSITKKTNLAISICGWSISTNELQLKDEIEKTRESLQREVKEKGQLLLIIDELDRCDPRFCVNLLETVKHFFDIDGLFIILSFNDAALSYTLSGVYGVDFFKDTKAENYLTKFIDERTKMYTVNAKGYLKIIREDFQKSQIEVTETQLKNVADVFSEMRLSLRKTKICLRRVIDLVFKFGDKDNIEFYSYVSYRYDNDLEKIDNKPLRNQYDEDDVYGKRCKLFAEFISAVGQCTVTDVLTRYRYGNVGESARKVLRDIMHKYHIVGYATEDYPILLKDIRSCYGLICFDQGNAEKLAEFFLSNLFDDIEPNIPKDLSKN